MANVILKYRSFSITFNYEIKISENNFYIHVFSASAV